MNYVNFQSKIMLKASRLFVFRARDCFVFIWAYGREANVGDKVGNIEKLRTLIAIFDKITVDNYYGEKSGT